MGGDNGTWSRNIVTPDTQARQAESEGYRPNLPQLSLSELDATPSSIGRNTLLYGFLIVALRVVELLVFFIASPVVASFLHVSMTHDKADYYQATLIAVCFYALFSEMSGVHDGDVRFSVRRAWARVFVALAATGMFLLTLSFLLKVSGDYSRAWAFVWMMVGGAAVCSTRAASVGYMRKLKRDGYFDQRVAIFGAGPQGDRLVQYIAGDSRLTIKLVGFFDDRAVGRIDNRTSPLPLLGTLADLVGEIRRGRVDQVIVALPWSADARLQEIVAELAATPIRIRLAPDLVSFAFSQRPIVRLGDVPVLALFERPISGVDQALKRMEDLLLGGLLLVLASPLFLILSLLIKLDSPGPVFFRQAREGFNSQRFLIWKFRTMRHESCDNGAIRQAVRGDPRVTGIGRILRRTSIDELPQLFNVLAGEMSLVGPRPHAPSTRAGGRLFSDVVKTYAARHNVRPGITGWAQVCGWRGETDTEEKLVRRLEHDLQYMERWSVWFDLYILIRTVASVTVTHRAY